MVASVVMSKDQPQSDYTEEEAARRRDELAKRILRMPPQPRKPHPSKAAKARSARLNNPNFVVAAFKAAPVLFDGVTLGSRVGGMEARLAMAAVFANVVRPFAS